MLQLLLLMNSVKISTMLQNGELDETNEKQPASAGFQKNKINYHNKINLKTSNHVTFLRPQLFTHHLVNR